MAKAPHTYIARIERTILEGEVVEVRLFPIQDHTQVSVEDGMEFVTVAMVIDPFEVPVD